MGKLKNSLIDVRSPYWPHHLEVYEYEYDTGTLLCFLEYSAPVKDTVLSMIQFACQSAIHICGGS